MCLYPKLLRNPKYKANKKNGGIPPKCIDKRLLYVPVGCGNCIECRQQKSREWQVRLNEELQTDYNAHFVTLTFSNESLEKLCKETGLNECNAVATIAVRRFLERVRKNTKKSLTHWLITELGHQNTERIHLHGLIWTKNKELIEKHWKYGNIFIGTYTNARTINYIVKYVTKIDTDHKDFKSIILCSKGIGEKYTRNMANVIQHNYKGTDTKEYYRLPNGSKVNMPIYYRNKFYTEEEKELLWLDKIDKQIIYVRGIKIDLNKENGYEIYLRTLKQQQEENIALGYGDMSDEWKKTNYNITLNMLRRAERKTKQLEEEYQRRLKTHNRGVVMPTAQQ